MGRVAGSRPGSRGRKYLWFEGLIEGGEVTAADVKEAKSCVIGTDSAVCPLQDKAYVEGVQKLLKAFPGGPALAVAVFEKHHEQRPEEI
jgi:hypothetical protein